MPSLTQALNNGRRTGTGSFHSSPSSSNFNMSFGTGRVYFKSKACLVMTVGVALLSLIFLVFGLWSGRIGSFNFFASPNIEYGIMIDAGSTGSRVHVYKFSSYADSQPILMDEVFHQIKPGLSSYAEHPENGAGSIETLLDIAKESIPKEKWHNTPLALKATAGLRLLPEKQSQALLNKVNELFKNSPFKIRDKPVSIMDGTDEGIFAWLTVNYLLDLIGYDTVGTIDLGGGSMQITFSPIERSTFETAPRDFLHDTTVFHHFMKVYVHSYLGLGLMSARQQVLGKANDATSSCMPVDYQGTWMNAGSKYNIKGELSGEGKFNACYGVVKKVIEGKIKRPDELKRETFYAFSYFFDRAAENGLIHPEDGGIVRVGKYEETARNVCDSKNHDPDSPFMCMDLTIITSFLKDGYGLPSDTKLQVRKKIKGKENSWALGATFFLMNDE